MEAILIEDRFSPPQEFEGVQIGKSTSRRQASNSWVDMSAYRLADGSLLLHRVGMSLIYHTSPTRCVTYSGRPRGDVATIDDLPDDAVPCQACRPPHPLDLGDDEKIRFEFPRNTLDVCPGYPEMVTKLTTMHARDTNIRTTAVSEPVRDLLAQCAKNDPEFAAAVAAAKERSELGQAS